MNFKFFIKKVIEALWSLRYPDTYKKLQRCDILLISHDNDLGITKNNMAYSPLIDSLFEKLEACGWQCSRFLLPYTHLDENQAFASPVRANRRLFFLMLLYKVSVLFKLHNMKCNFLRFEAFSIRSFYKKFFQAIECKCIIGIGLNSNICKAANELGIFSVEVAHGIGLAQLPLAMHLAKRDELPKGILTFDSVTYKTFSQLVSKNIVVKYAPHLWLSRFEPEARCYLPLEWVEKILIDKKYKKTVLLTLQWGYDGEFSPFTGIIKNGILSPCLEEAIKETRDNVFWLIRLHPIQLRDHKYTKHRKYIENLTQTFTNCEWQKASTLPLPSVLLQCDGHLTMSSMSSYEAAYMGIKTLLLCPTLKKNGIHENYFGDLKTLNMAKLGNLNRDEIMQWIYSIEPAEKYSFNPQDTLEETIQWIVGDIRC